MSLPENDTRDEATAERPAGESDPDLAIAETQISAPDDTVSSMAETLPGTGAPADSSAPVVIRGGVAELARGATFGHFLVLEQLGAGGMGVVLSAYDPKLDRRVAIKVLKPTQYADGTASAGQQRLLREAKAMARLSHPNVVTVYEVGIYDDQVFVVMEYVDGQTLRDWLEHRSRSWQDIVSVFVRAGRGLMAAHDAGLVHRDFKPENVLIGKDGRVRVTDFGLASTVTHEVAPEPHAAAEVPDVSTTLTQTGALLGTPAYMAPEQHQGKRVDARADQFAFCVALYEALYGQRPFAGDSFAEIVAAVLEDEPRPIPRDAPGPGWLRTTIERGLARDPDRRYPSMSALLGDLEPAPRRRRVGATMALAALALAGVTALALFRGAGPEPCAGASELLQGAWDREVEQSARAAFAATGLSHAGDTFARASALLDDYAGRWVDMRTAACKATRLRREQSEALLDLRMHCLDGRLARVRALSSLWRDQPDSRVVDHALESVHELPDLAACADVEALTAAVPLPADDKARAALNELEHSLARANSLYRAGRIDEALALIQEVETRAREIGYAPLVAEVVQDRGQMESNNDPGAALATLEQAFLLAAQARDDARMADLLMDRYRMLGYSLDRFDDARLLEPIMIGAVTRVAGREDLEARLHEVQGAVAEEADDHEAAHRHRSRVVELARKLHGEESREYAEALGQLGTALSSQGKLAEARKLYEQALAIDQKIFGDDHPALSGSLYRLAKIADQLGEYQLAHDHFTRVLELRRRGLKEDDLQVANVLNSLGVTSGRIGKRDEAIALFKEALAIYEARVGPESADVAMVLNNMGSDHSDHGDHALAEQMHRRALAIREKIYGEHHSEVARALNNLGLALKDQKRYDEAMAVFRRALAIHEHLTGPESIAAASPLNNMGLILYEQERYREAIPYYERATAIFDKVLGEHPQTFATYYFYGDTLAEAKQLERAEDALRRALAVAEAIHAPGHSNTLYAMSYLGQVLVDRGRAAEAVPLLESAATELAGKGSDGDLAQVRFLLARALWESGGDRKRAIALATQARDELARSGAAPEVLVKMRTWLRRRR